MISSGHCFPGHSGPDPDPFLKPGQVSNDTFKCTSQDSNKAFKKLLKISYGLYTYSKRI
jgi:hypothetical protein